MKWFWYSLFFFILLMCSCRSKEVATSCSKRLQIASEVNLLAEKAKIDTTKTIRSEQLSENRSVIETIVVIEYDKESGKAVKETTTKRKIVQDSDKVVSAKEERRVYEVRNDSLNHILDVTKMMDAESESVTENQGFGSAWAKFGEVMGIGTLIVIAYLCWKLKSRVN